MKNNSNLDTKMPYSFFFFAFLGLYENLIYGIW